MTEPFIKIGHRNGNVFLRVVFDGPLGRQSVVCKMTPKEAADLREELSEAAFRASKRPAILHRSFRSDGSRPDQNT